jgi:RHS repeat-associated protein
MIELGTSADNSADSCLVYNYFTSWTARTSCPSPSAVPTSGAGNNGNVMGYWYQDSVSTSLSHTATYTFDGVNRLTAAAATGNSTYSQSYNYTSDGSSGQFGNMSCSLGSSGYCPQVTFSSSTNRITNIGSASASYDAAGNMTNDGSHNYTWDAEGRAVTVDGGSTRTFTYNALGERVEWAYPGGAAEMLFDPSGTWLGQAGNYSLVNFGAGHGVTYGGGETYFNHYNSLGSSSMQTKHDGSVVEDMTFYPFGTVWAEPLSGYGYNFASLPARDLGSNTDITAFRQYNFTLGRWLSPDPLAGDITNPQSLNRYAYVMNNPTSFVDPPGLKSQAPCVAPPGYVLMSTNPCAKRPAHTCGGMVCADQYYGGSLFEGYVGYQGENICLTNGVLGYCNEGALGLIVNGNDEFDATAQANGMSFTPAGQTQIDSSGRSSTGTGSFTFDAGAWMQAEGFRDSGILGKYAPISGYGTIMTSSGTQSAAWGSFAESLTPMQGTNFLSTVYSTDPRTGFNYFGADSNLSYLNGSLNSFNWYGNVTASFEDGVLTIYITNPHPH